MKYTPWCRAISVPLAGAWTVVAHSGHKVTKARAGPRRQRAEQASPAVSRSLSRGVLHLDTAVNVGQMQSTSAVARKDIQVASCWDM